MSTNFIKKLFKIQNFHPKLSEKRLRIKKRAGGAVGISVFVLLSKSWLNGKIYSLTASWVASVLSEKLLTVSRYRL